MVAADPHAPGPAAAARPPSLLLHTALVVLLFSAMNFGRHFTAVVVLKLLPLDIVLGALLVYAVLTRRFRFRLGGELLILFGFMALNVAYEIFSVIAIDGGTTENISLAVALLRNAALIFSVAQLDYDHERARRWLLGAGAFFSLIAIAGYVHASLDAARILSTYSLHDPGIFYSVDSRQIRLQGLREDPNFFFIINLIPLLMGVSLIRERRELWPLFATGVVLAASVLTFSRSGALLLLLLVVILVAVDLSRFNVGRLAFTATAVILVVLGSRFVSATFDLPDVGKVMAARFERGGETGGSGRFRLWAFAWEGFQDAVVFGKGGRYTYRTYGQYAHNDYLEMLSSHGLVGFALMIGTWLAVISFVASRSLAARLVPLFAYSAICFVVMLGASFFFTIYYNPYIWFVVALLFSRKEGAWAASR